MTLPSSRRCSLTTGSGVKALLIKRRYLVNVLTLTSPARVRIIAPLACTKSSTSISLRRTCSYVVTQGIHAQEQLHAAALVFDMREGDFALGIQTADPAHHRHFERRHLLQESSASAATSLRKKRIRTRIGDAMDCGSMRAGYRSTPMFLQAFGFFQPLKFQFRRLPHDAASLLAGRGAVALLTGKMQSSGKHCPLSLMFRLR